VQKQAGEILWQAGENRQQAGKIRALEERLASVETLLPQGLGIGRRSASKARNRSAF
jgi:hypothetical protein